MNKVIKVLCISTISALALVCAFLLGKSQRQSISFEEEYESYLSNQPPDAYAGFHRWPLSKQAKESSLILKISFEENENYYMAIVAEILKKPANNALTPKIGDEFKSYSYTSKKNIMGDGVIAFFVGPQFEKRRALSYRNNKVGRYSDMPLAHICELIRNAVEEPKRSDFQNTNYYFEPFEEQ